MFGCRTLLLGIGAVMLTFALVYYADSLKGDWGVVENSEVEPGVDGRSNPNKADKSGGSAPLPNPWKSDTHDDSEEGDKESNVKKPSMAKVAGRKHKKVLMKDEEKHVLTGSPENDRPFVFCEGERNITARSRIAILTISHDQVRDVRPHVLTTGKYMRKYASRVGADFHILDTTCADILAPYESAKALNISIDRSLKLYAKMDFEARARMHKLLIGHFLDVYDRILLLDDTVVVNPGSPDLFQIVPDGWLGASFERPKSMPPYPDWWIKQRVRWFCAHYLRAKCYGLNDIFNSGVMLFDKSMKHTLFNPHYFHRYRYVSGFFDQAYFNAMMAGHKIKFFDLGVSFNQVGSLIKAKPKEQKKITGLVNEEVCFPHMTRAIPNRAWVAKFFERMYKKAANAGKPYCKYECGDYGCWVPKGPLPKPLAPLNITTVPIQKKERWDHAHHKWVIFEKATKAKFADDIP